MCSTRLCLLPNEHVTSFNSTQKVLKGETETYRMPQVFCFMFLSVSTCTLKPRFQIETNIVSLDGVASDAFYVNI